MQRLKVKEVLKPSVSNGVFCILFVAVDKKYAAGGKQETTTGKSGPPEAVPYKRKAPVGTKKKTCKEGTDSHDQPADWSRNDGFSI